MTVSAPPLDHLDLPVLAQHLGLVEEIEQYLAGLPPPPTASPAALPPAQPGSHGGRYGSVRQPWNHGYPLPRRTLLDRLGRRPGPPGARHRRRASAADLPLPRRGRLDPGAMWDAAGRVCLLGAQTAVLAHGYGTAYTVRRARAQVMEVLHATGRPTTSPDLWNDLPGRRQAEVHALLQRAEARAESLGI
ncbi:DUF6197 family protein [Kitasatospora cheerisanensis]|uniref:DUF6197 family protein n=1 Tax=Kitasatospora cheerisanensis TaxID=81942 RepID=UPI00055C5A36|nr:hypothetical protein [Kitasatospora cheerisanensis]